MFSNRHPTAHPSLLVSKPKFATISGPVFIWINICLFDHGYGYTLLILPDLCHYSEDITMTFLAF